MRDARLAPLVTTLQDAVVGDVARTLWVLLASVAFVLLIAGANVANLFVVRADARRREVAMRVAMGARRGHVVRGALAESVLVAGSSAVIASGGGALALTLLRALGPESLPRIHELRPDAMFVATTLVAGAITSVALAALTLAGPLPGYAALREGGRTTTGGRKMLRARNVLAAGQVALAMVLVVSAGLMLRSFSRLRQIDPGFDATNVLTFELGLPRLVYPTRERAVAAEQEILARLRAIPGVAQAGLTTCLPLCGSWAGNPWRVEDHPVTPGTVAPVGATRRVSAGYLEALRVPLVEGRLLTPDDAARRTGAAVISAQLAARLWPGVDPLGRRLYHDGEPASPQWYTVVGVVANTPIRGLTDDPTPIAYLPLLHSDSTRGPGPWFVSFVVRGTVPAASLAEPVRRAVADVDPNLPLSHVRPLESIVVQAGSRMAFTMVLLLGAASLALLLGVVGTYGVLSYVVSRRATEFGIRMALGARRASILALVMRHMAVIVGSGLVAGTAAALALTRYLRALLYGVTPGDAATYAVVVAVLATAGLAAAFLPARRATGVAPADALRAE